VTETDGLVGLGPAVWSVDAGDTIADLVWSPTDERLAVGCSGGDVAVFDEAGQVIDRRLRHPSGTSCVTWFGGDVASGGVDGWVDVGGHRERHVGWVSALAPSDTGLGVAHGREISILGGPSSDRLPASVAQIRWTTGPGETNRLIACGHGYIAEFDATLRHRNDANLVWGGSVEQVDWSPEGRWAAASTRGTTNYLWLRPTAEDGRVIDPQVHVHVLPCPASNGRLVRFDPTGRHLGIATSGGLAVFDLDDVHPIAGPPGRLLPLFCRVHAFSWWPDAPVAVLGVATDSGGGGLLLVRCDEHAAPVGVVDLGSAVTGIAWSSGSDLVAAACADGTVHALRRIEDWDWRASTGERDATDRL